MSGGQYDVGQRDGFGNRGNDLGGEMGPDLAAESGFDCGSYIVVIERGLVPLDCCCIGAGMDQGVDRVGEGGHHG